MATLALRVIFGRASYCEKGLARATPRFSSKDCAVQHFRLDDEPATARYGALLTEELVSA